jgi:hypothetical protein
MGKLYFSCVQERTFQFTFLTCIVQKQHCSKYCGSTVNVLQYFL